MKNKKKIKKTLNDGILKFMEAQGASLPHFKKLSFLERLNPNSLSKVMVI